MRQSSAVLAILVFQAGCGLLPGPTLPAPAASSEPLALRVVYPRPERLDAVVPDGDTLWLTTEPGYAVGAIDSMFVFGGAGRGDAQVTVNGYAADVNAQTGGWLAWIPAPTGADSARFVVTAHWGGSEQSVVLAAPRLPAFTPPDSGLWVDTTSFQPVGSIGVAPDERVVFRVAAAGRARLWLIQGSDTLEMVGDDVAAASDPGALAFSVVPVQRRDTRRSLARAWNPGDSLPVTLLAVMDGDSASYQWPVEVTVLHGPRAVLIDDDPARAGSGDGITPGRPAPGATYHWFFPAGTRSRVTGWRGDQQRVELARGVEAWVSGGEIQWLPEGAPLPEARVLPPRLFEGERTALIRIPVTDRVPFRTDAGGTALVLTLYSAAADIDWLQYGAGGGEFVRLMRFAQPVADQVELHFDFSVEPWGYRTRWEGATLILEARRPPRISGRRPLRGMVVAVDAGHPPVGSIGPAGMTEWDMTLRVARELKGRLESRGATVVMTRDTDGPVSLADRVAIAESADADLLVSIHGNALPDGVNPYTNGGTSVYYFHPRSAPLARFLNVELVRAFGSRDLGFGRGDLHMVRPTWMPSALVEGLFVMLPEHEALLLSEQGVADYARGVVRGLERFLRSERGE